MKLFALLTFAPALAFASPKLPAHYAKMFDPKSTWTYQVTTVGAATTVVCKVARVATYTTVIASEITCDSAISEFPIPDVYLATSSGLYRSGTGFPDAAPDASEFALHQLLIAATPKATSKTVTKYAVVDGKALRVTTVFGVRRDPFGERSAKDKTWCWFRTTKRGTSEHTDTRCFSGAITYGTEGALSFRVE